MTYERTDADRYGRGVIGGWLLAWRTMTGVSQRRLAAIAGIDQGGLSRIERGLASPSGWRLARIIIVLDWLSGGGDRAGPWVPASGRSPWRFDRFAGPRPPAVVGRIVMPPPLDGVPRDRVPPPDELPPVDRGRAARPGVGA